jgi:hypothetical protein
MGPQREDTSVENVTHASKPLALADCVCVRERECVYVCVRECVRQSRWRVYLCVCERESELVSVRQRRVYLCV